MRNHVIHTSPSNLITIAGGKWTTYRSMAKETIDAAVEACDLPAKGPYACDVCTERREGDRKQE